ncbi:histidine--tRNA ligase [Fulvivirga lutea]
MQMARRNYIINTIKSVFEKFGFMPLETPAMENLSTLTGKYGDEGDQLLFKVLNSGDYLVELVKIRHEFGKFLREQFIPELQQQKDPDNYFNSVIESLAKKTNPSNQEIFNSHYLQKLQKKITSLIGELNSKKEEFDKLEKYFLKFFQNNDIVTNQILSLVDEELESKKTLPLLAEKGLKYDLTVPFARYVVMNQHDITFPFKRFQIQPVWRADRPQKGRYREFYQCDADVVGTDSLVCEAEIILMINEVFDQLGFDDYTIKINHRGILSGIAEVIGAQGKESDLFVAIDKLDKIGLEKVCDELIDRGISQEAVEKLKPILKLSGNIQQVLDSLTNLIGKTAAGQKGISDLTEMFDNLKSFGLENSNAALDVTLARGLSYYTGAIFEVKINNVSIGSVSGGGRYDDLTGVFGLSGTSGVGFSFGIDRLYDCLEELNLFKENTQTFSQALIVHFDEDSMKYGLTILSKLRSNGIKSEIYPDQAKLKKQFGYADKKNIPYTITIGSEEMKSGKLALKDLHSGEQESLSVDEIINKLKGK